MESQPPTPGSSRELIDPITHEHVVIHDNTSQELDDVLPDFDRAEETMASDNVVYSSMETVVRQEAGSSWWKDHDSNKLRMQVALLVALAAAFGSSGSFILLWVLNGFHLGPVSWNFIFASALFSLPCVAATCFLYLVNQPRRSPSDPESSQAPPDKVLNIS
jgi:hypothetical protein